MDCSISRLIKTKNVDLKQSIAIHQTRYKTATFESYALGIGLNSFSSEETFIGRTQ